MTASQPTRIARASDIVTGLPIAVARRCRWDRERKSGATPLETLRSLIHAFTLIRDGVIAPENRKEAFVSSVGGYSPYALQRRVAGDKSQDAKDAKAEVAELLTSREVRLAIGPDSVRALAWVVSAPLSADLRVDTASPALTL